MVATAIFEHIDLTDGGMLAAPGDLTRDLTRGLTGDLRGRQG